MTIKKTITLFGIIMTLIWSMFVFVLVDSGLNEGCNFSNYIRTERACDFVVPSNFRLVHSIHGGKYAIQVLDLRQDKADTLLKTKINNEYTSTLDLNDQYLYRSWTFSEIESMYPYIGKISIFSDSCKAKGYLKEYLEMDKSMLYYR